SSRNDFVPREMVKYKYLDVTQDVTLDLRLVTLDLRLLISLEFCRRTAMKGSCSTPPPNEVWRATPLERLDLPKRTGVLSCRLRRGRIRAKRPNRWRSCRASIGVR